MYVYGIFVILVLVSVSVLSPFISNGLESLIKSVNIV